MTQRSTDLQLFLDAAFAAYDQFTRAPEARRAIAAIADALEQPAPERTGAGGRLPIVASQLDAALAVNTEDETLRTLVERFRILEPRLEWQRTSRNGETASENFVEGHANAMIVGPGALEPRKDVWLGVSLMAPQVRYPDHDHAPEEVYLVLSDSQFRQGDGEWFSPGIGGTFYNRPGILHAMRALGSPLFAFWALREAV